jgi:hypothetical protein
VDAVHAFVEQSGALFGGVVDANAFDRLRARMGAVERRISFAG